MLFNQILRMIYDSLKSVINAFDVPLFIIPGTEVDITFWELILGFLLVGIIFGFFLAPRVGSGLGAIGNVNEFNNVKRENARRAEEKAFNDSFLGYAQRRYKKEAYSYEYNRLMGNNALKGKKK